MDAVTFNGKIVKSKRFLLLTAMKCNILFSFIGELNKTMLVAFHIFKTAKDIKLSDEYYLTKFVLVPNSCDVLL